MRILSIHTEMYPMELRRFFPKDSEGVLEQGCENGVSYVRVCNRQSERAKLQSLMEYILLSDNPALAESEKIFGSVAELAFQPTRGLVKVRLEEFLKDSRSINIDGYINFRLSEYSARINAILYSIIKKNLYKS